MIYQELREHCANFTKSELARKLRITPSSVRHHGIVLGLTFKEKKGWSTKMIQPVEGEFFDESHRENWLV